MKQYKRIVIVVAILIPFLAYLPIRVHLTYTPKVLQEKLAQEGCFYNSAEDRYQITGVDFGEGLSETVAALGLKGWFTNGDIEDYLNLGGEGKYTITDPLIVSAFNAKYVFSISLSKYKCYQISFYGSFVLDPETPIPYENVMEYDDACTYFYNLYNEFVASYGEPDVSDFPIDLNEITLDYFTDERSYYPDVCAYWIAGKEGQQSVLRLSATPWYTKDTESNRVMDLRVYIDIGQEIEGISIDDLT